MTPSLRLFLTVSMLGSASLPAQTPKPLSTVEPGLESAVKWKWQVAPSDPRSWVSAVQPKPTPGPVVLTNAPTDTPPKAELAKPEPVPLTGTHVIQQGDRLIRIAKKYGITVEALKSVNGLKGDLIHVGQELRIPSPSEAKAAEIASVTPAAEIKQARENLAIQVFLDREQFSAGPIDGEIGGDLFHKMLMLYQSSREYLDMAGLREKARAAVGDGLTKYTLKAEDLRYVIPQRMIMPPPAPPKGKNKKPPQPKPAPLTYEDLTSANFLGYRSAWEFVAERFHCSEEFLRGLNPHITGTPSEGTEFRVPNVVPFEIESALNDPLQPAADAESPVTAAVFEMQLLGIFRKGQLVAVVPFSTARPGLRGKGTWTILNAIPRPRLSTLRESKDGPAKTAAPLFGANANPTGAATPTPTPQKPALTAPEYLPPGPNNPAGIIWINLAKAGSTEPLPYGLHGTSVPEKMKTTESIGGFRVSNWDVARAVRLLPEKTPLEWKAGSQGAAPVAQPVF